MNEPANRTREEHLDELRLFVYLMSGSLLESELVPGIVSSRAGTPGTPARDLLFARAAEICLQRLAGRPARGLPSLASAPRDPLLPPEKPPADLAWIEPFPDALVPVAPGPFAPDGGYGARESVSLYMAAALQAAPPEGRAAFILADLFGWPPGEAGEVLGIEEKVLRSSLEEAREAVARSYRQDLGRREPPPDSEATLLSMRYLHPWETADVEGLVARLDADVVVQCPPSPSWYRGSGAFARFASEHLLPEGSRGRWRLLPLRANGQVGFGVYTRDGVGRVYVARSIQVLFFDRELVSEIVCFGNGELFAPFGLPGEVPIQGSIT